MNKNYKDIPFRKLYIQILDELFKLCQEGKLECVSDEEDMYLNKTKVLQISNYKITWTYECSVLTSIFSTNDFLVSKIDDLYSYEVSCRNDINYKL